MRKALHLMGYLDDGDVQWMATQGKIEGVPAGTVQVREGTPLHSLFIVLDGEFSVSVAGVARPIATLHSGEIIGEISFVDSRPPAATVRSTTAAHVLAVPHDIIWRKLQTDGAFAARFYRGIAGFLADRLRSTVGRLGYGSQPAEAGDDELFDAHLETVSMAAARMDRLIRSLQTPAGVTA